MEMDERDLLMHFRQGDAAAANAAPSHDLWPALRQRLEEKPKPLAWNWAWFDAALAAGLLALVAAFPASIPVLLYYL
jgi:hypothetical protein